MNIYFFLYLEYYRIKTEEIREQAAEQKRKLEEARRTGALDVMDLTSYRFGKYTSTIRRRF